MSTKFHDCKPDIVLLKRRGAQYLPLVLRKCVCRALKQESAFHDQNRNRIDQILVKRRENKPPRQKAPRDLDVQLPLSDHVEAGSATAVASTVSGNQNPFDAAASPRVLSDSQLLNFERLGHMCTRSLLDGAQVTALHGAVQKEADNRQLVALSHRIRVLLPADKHVPVHSKEQALRHLKRHGQELGFMQHFNLHR